ATTTSARVTLAGMSRTRPDGKWVLLDDIRAACLAFLSRTGFLGDALDANADLPDARRDKVRELAFGPGIPGPAWESTDELLEYAAVCRWLEPVGVIDESVGVAVEAVLERRALLDPLRALVGEHFRGRVRERQVVADFIGGRSPFTLLTVRGPGGVGKSSLLGSALLDLELRATSAVPFAYLDFDRVRNDPRDGAGLLRQIARQVRLQYAATDDARLFAAVESASDGSDLFLASEILDLDLTGERELPDLVGLFADQLGTLLEDVLTSEPPVSLVLFLDSVEEVQLKGPGAVRDLTDFLLLLRAKVPGLRVVSSSRGDPPAFPGFAKPYTLTLGDLDAESADQVLGDLGVVDSTLRQTVVRRFGGNPLTLRLAADVVRKIGAGAIDDIVGQADAVAGIAGEQVLGLLYDRVLAHIRDPEVRRVAYPGLAVRLVTVDVLRRVLAEPCGFDPEDAESLFQRLRTEAGLFEADGPDVLRHRPDVRMLMLRTMRDEPLRAATVARVHQLAIEYYGGRDSVEDRAEEVYHRLMSGEDPRGLDRLWHPDLRRLLASALGEPLPPAAAGWLERRMGVGDPDDQTAWDQEDWEADASVRANSWLASGDTGAALAVLAERPERLPGSALHAVAVRTRLMAGDVDGAETALRDGIAATVDSDHTTLAALAELAIEVRAQQENPSGVVTAAQWAVRTCDLLGDRTRAVGVLTDAIQRLHGLGEPADGLGDQLATRFGEMTRAEMVADPNLVRRVLRVAGPVQESVIYHAATEVGDHSEVDTGVFNADPYAVAEMLEHTSGADTALARLVDEVGLHSKRFALLDLARQVLRSGRTGRAVVIGLDWAEDGVDMPRLVVETLVRAPGTRRMA
ncbi:MAG: ATP-binding protein, partial [Umezawaea sp.]